VVEFFRWRRRLIGGRPRMTARVLDELDSISPMDELECAHLADARSWVTSGVPICRIEKPATPPKHLVSYFALVDQGHILLVDHRNAQLWLPTGGHVAPGEDPRLTVVRELREELGLSIGYQDVGPPQMVTVTSTVGRTRGHTDVSLWYAVKGNRESTLVFDTEEFHDARWFSFDNVPLHRSDPNLSRFLAKLRRTRV
jgi:8-oxo-dGTP diphosphatase